MRLSVVLLFAFYALSAEAAPTIGTNFVVAFPCLGNNANLFLYVTNPSGNEVADLRIYSSNPDFDPMEQSVDPQSTLEIPFYNPDLQICDNNNVVVQKGILVQSTVSVSVYVNIEATDGTQVTNFLVLPTTVLGRQYALQNKAYNILIALQDNTQVTFSETTTNVVLNRLEAVRLQRGGNITSNNPVALVYSAGYYSGSSYSHDAVMALQVGIKATEFPLVTHPNVSSTNVRVYAFDDHTYVILNGLTQNQINAGSYYDFTVSGPSVIATSKKAQIVTGDSYYYQPSAQVVSSTFYLTAARYPFHTMTHIPYSSRDPVHTLVVITTTTGAGQISLDGTVIPALQYRRIASSSYYYATVPVSGDQHVITTNSANVKYTASVYSTYYNAQYANAKFNIGLDLPAVTDDADEGSVKE